MGAVLWALGRALHSTFVLMFFLVVVVVCGCSSSISSVLLRRLSFSFGWGTKAWSGSRTWCRDVSRHQDVVVVGVGGVGVGGVGGEGAGNVTRSALVVMGVFLATNIQSKKEREKEREFQVFMIMD